MTLSNVTNGLANSCSTITARRPERLTWQGRAGRRGEHCAHSFLRSWRVACAQKFHFFLRSRDRGSEDAVVFPEI